MMPSLPDDVGGQPLEEYILRFDRELQAIAAHTKTLTDPDGMVPSTLLRIQEQMANTFKDTDAYKNAGPSRGEGVVPAELGATTSASSGGVTPTLKQNQDLVKQLLGPTVGKSPTASIGGMGEAGTGWLQRVQQNQSFQLPRYGQLTVQDTLNYLSGMMANAANRVRQQSPEWQTFNDLHQTGQLVDPLTGQFTQQGQEAANALANLNNGGGGRWGRASNVVSSMASGYAQGKAISDLVKQVADPILGYQNLAYLTGYQGGPGIMGFHPAAAWQGFGQRRSEVGFAFGNNVSPNQAASIYNNLFGLGWFGGGSTNAMRQGLAQITQTNPLLGTDPQVAAMMDQATRMGAASVSQFVEVMKQVPSAANAAHVSIAQVVSDANALGQYYKSIGGTAIAGQQAATQFNTVTGLPAGVFQQFLQNPMVQGQVFMQSGLLPWEQGSASFGNQMGGILRSLNLFSHAVNLPPVTQRDTIGITRQVSSTDRVASLMSHYFGVDQATIKNMMQHQSGIIAGTNIQQNMTDYLNAVKQGQIGYNDPAWQNLVGQMRMARDWSGNPMFTAAQINQIQNAGNGNVLKGPGNQSIIDWMNANTAQGGGRAPGNWQTRESLMWRRNHGHQPTQADLVKLAQQSGELPSYMSQKVSKATGGDIAQAREQAIQKILAGHTQSINQGPQVTISLSGTAAKLFKLSSNSAQGKAQANAGGSSVNVPYGSGPTDAALYANPDTSGVTANPSWGSSANQAPNWETP